MRLFNLLEPNQTDQVFLSCMQVLSQPCIREGCVYKSHIGNIEVEFDGQKNYLLMDYSKTQLRRKRGTFVSSATVLRSHIANAVVLNIAFEVFKDCEFLGFGVTDGYQPVLGLKYGAQLYGIVSDVDGDIKCIRGDGYHFDKDGYAGLGVALSSALPVIAFDRISQIRDAGFTE